MDMDKLIRYEEARQNYLYEILKLKSDMKIWKTLIPDIERIENELKEAEAIGQDIGELPILLYKGEKECNVSDFHLGMRFQRLIDVIESRKIELNIPIYRRLYEDFLDTIKEICK